MTDQYLMLTEPGRLARHPKRLILAERRAERERLECFSQPASLITYRRRQGSNVEDIKTVWNGLENLHMMLLCKKGSHGVGIRGKQRSVPLLNRLESISMYLLKSNVQKYCSVPMHLHKPLLCSSDKVEKSAKAQCHLHAEDEAKHLESLPSLLQHIICPHIAEILLATVTAIDDHPVS